MSKHTFKIDYLKLEDAMISSEDSPIYLGILRLIDECLKGNNFPDELCIRKTVTTSFENPNTKHPDGTVITECSVCQRTLTQTELRHIINQASKNNNITIVTPPKRDIDI